MGFWPKGDPLFAAVAVLLLCLLSFANGANDVSKGIATLAGSGVTDTRRAMAWGSVWTVAGALAGLFLGINLVTTFSKGIYLGDPSLSLPMALAIAIAPSLWVLLATRFGWPVSTTHALTGGLLGMGVLAFGWGGVNWGNALTKIVIPLVASPFISIILAFALFPILKRGMAVVENHCLCLAPFPQIVSKVIPNGAVTNAASAAGLPVLGRLEECRTAVAGWSLKRDQVHWLTSGLVSFSRGLNDTPKLIAVILPFLLLSNSNFNGWLFLVAAVAMGLGSWIAGRKVTDILGYRVTRMDHDQGFSANFVTSLLVIFASPFGLPVSTTHVSTSAIMGVGLAGNRGLDRRKVLEMILAWIVTVPASAALGMALLTLLKEIS